MVYAHGLEPCGETRESSSLSFGTISVAALKPISGSPPHAGTKGNSGSFPLPLRGIVILREFPLVRVSPSAPVKTGHSGLTGISGQICVGKKSKEQERSCDKVVMFGVDTGQASMVA